MEPPRIVTTYPDFGGHPNGAISPFSPDLTPVSTPRAMIPTGPLPYGGDDDLENAIRMAMAAKDGKAWKILIQARTVRNNMMKTAAVVEGGDLRPVLQKLGWTDNELSWAQGKAEGNFIEGIKLLLKEESGPKEQFDDSVSGSGQAGFSPRPKCDGEEDVEDDDSEEDDGEAAAVSSTILRRLSVDSTWQLLRSTSKSSGDEPARRKAWKDAALVLVQISSLQRQGRISLSVKAKMKKAVAQGLANEVRRLLQAVNQPEQQRHSVDREDSLFASYTCGLTGDLLYEPVTLSCGHTFSKRALEGVLITGNKKCPVCRCPISGGVDELKVNILLRDTISRLFADRILLLVKRDIAALKPSNIEMAAEELFFVFERYKDNEDVVDVAVHTLLTWVAEKKNLGPISRRGLTRQLLQLVTQPRVSVKFLRRTAPSLLDCLCALGSGTSHAAKVMGEAAAWDAAVKVLDAARRLKGAELEAVTVRAFRVATVAMRANQETAAVLVDLMAFMVRVMGTVGEDAQSIEVLLTGLALCEELLHLAEVKGYVRLPTPEQTQQVTRWWFLYASSRVICSAAASFLTTALFLTNKSQDPDLLTSTLLSCEVLDLALTTLTTYPDDAEVIRSTVPLLLRLGFAAEDPTAVVDDDVAAKLKAASFLKCLKAYIDGLHRDDEDQQSHMEEPIIFERTANSRIEIHDGGNTLVCKGKGWALGSAITTGNVCLTFDVRQEDLGDECTCVGISLSPDPPKTAEYRSAGSPFISLRLFSGEVYRDSKVIHAADQFKCHPGDSIRVTVDLEAGSLSFQVRDGPSVLVASDLKGRTVYPVCVFYLGELQPDRNVHPIINFTSTRVQGPAGPASVAAEAPLTFTFPSPNPILHEGNLLCRSSRTPVDEVQYGFAFGPGAVQGFHTYLFKQTTALSVSFGLVSSDAVTATKPPTSSSSGLLHATFLLQMWNTGHIASGALPDGTRPVAYEGSGFLKPDEPVTLRVKLDGDDKFIEVVRNGKVVHAVEKLHTLLPAGLALHPFVALLAPEDAVNVEHRIIVPRRSALGGLDRRKWASQALVLLKDQGTGRRLSRSLALESPSKLTWSFLLHHLEEADSHGFYRATQLLEEVNARLQVADRPDGVSLAAIARAVCCAGLQGCWEAREHAIEILASSAFAVPVGDLVSAGVLALLLKHHSAVPPWIPTDAELRLLGRMVDAAQQMPAVADYLMCHGVLQLLVETARLEDTRARHALDKAMELLDLDSSGGPVQASLRQARHHAQEILHRAVEVLSQRGEAFEAAVRETVEVDQLISGLATLPAVRDRSAEGLGKKLHRLFMSDYGVPGTLVEEIGYRPVASAQPYMVEPSSVDLDAYGSAYQEPVVLQRRRVAELQEGWRGHLGPDGSTSRCWEDAVFWAVYTADIEALRWLLAASHFAPFIADRAVFTPGVKGPWSSLLPASALPCTLLGALRVALTKGGVSEEMATQARNMLLHKARAFRRAKREVDERNAGPPKRYITYPRADGSIGTLHVEYSATTHSGYFHDDLVYSAVAPGWGYARVVGVDEAGTGKLWVHFQSSRGAVTTESGNWGPMHLKLVRSSRDPGAGGASTVFRLPLERGTRVVRGPHWEWGNQDSFPGNVGTVLGNGGGEGWYRVQWDGHTSNSYQYTPTHQDIVRYNDPLDNPLSALFPAVDSVAYMDVGSEHLPIGASRPDLKPENVVTDPRKAYRHACLDALGARWQSHQKTLSAEEAAHMWTVLTKLTVGDAEAVDRVFAAKSFAHEVVEQALSDATSETALLFLANAVHYGSASTLARVLGSVTGSSVLPTALSIVLMEGASDAQLAAALILLEHATRRSVDAARHLAGRLEVGDRQLRKFVDVLLTRVLNPSRTSLVYVHLSALCLVHGMVVVDAKLVAKLRDTEFRSEIATIIETYTRYSSSLPAIEELLSLVSVLEADADVRSKHHVRAAALMDDYARVTEELARCVCATSRQAIVQILRESLQAKHHDTLLRERSVLVMLRVGTLNAVIEGVKAGGGGKEDLLGLAELTCAMLRACDGKDQVVDKIVTPSLVSALAPGLDPQALGRDDDVAMAVLKVLAARLPAEGRQYSRKKRPALWPAVSQAGHLAALYASHGLARNEVAKLTLRVLTDVVRETEELEPMGFRILLQIVNLKAYEEDVLGVLKIWSYCRHSLEANFDVALPAMVRWLLIHRGNPLVLDAGLSLLLQLVSSTQTVLPEQVFLSSGAVNLRRLFVQPQRPRSKAVVRDESLATTTEASRSREESSASLSTAAGTRTSRHSSVSSVPLVDVSRMFARSTRDVGDSEGEEEEDEVAQATDRTSSLDGEHRGDEADEEAEDDNDGTDEEEEEDGEEEEEGDEDDEDDEGDEDGGEGVEGQEGDDEEALQSPVVRQEERPGWEPTKTRLPHYAQFHLSKEEHAAWRALEMEQKDYGDHTPKGVEVWVGKASNGSLPIPQSGLRRVKALSLTNHRQTGWLTILKAEEMEDDEDVVQLLITSNYSPSEVMSKVSRLRVLAKTRALPEEIAEACEAEGLPKVLLRAGTEHREARRFLRTLSLFLKRFFPCELEELLSEIGTILTNAECDVSRARSAGITFSDDHRRATFPFGPKLLLSASSSADGVLRWVMKSSGNSSWAVGAVPVSKIDRPDVMMVEQSLAVATTGLAGGRVSARRHIQCKKIEVILNMETSRTLTVKVDDDRENPIVVEVPTTVAEPLHLAIMGYSGTCMQFYDEF